MTTEEPHADPPQDDPLTSAWTSDQAAVMVSLRQWAIAYNQFNHELASWLGVPVSDATALGLVVWSAETTHPISPTELGTQLGLTSGAVSIMLRRLESVGLLTRQRHTTDLRRVSLRPTEEGRRRCREFLAVAGQKISQLLGQTRGDTVRVVATFLESMSTATSQGLDDLRAQRVST